MEDIYLGIGSRIRHPEWGVGIIVQVTSDDYQITFVNHGNKVISKQYGDLEIIEIVETSNDLISLANVESLLRKIISPLVDFSEEIRLSDKWVGGKLILQSGNPELKPYEMSLDTFFHKIVMVRDKMRVLEQRVNSSRLSDEEKVNLQQYITRVYGSLTSFNILFKSREDGFVS